MLLKTACEFLQKCTKQQSQVHISAYSSDEQQRQLYLHLPDTAYNLFRSPQYCAQEVETFTSVEFSSCYYGKLYLSIVLWKAVTETELLKRRQSLVT